MKSEFISTFSQFSKDDFLRHKKQNKSEQLNLIW